MSHWVNTQAFHLGDQIWCRAPVKWVWWPPARPPLIVTLKQNHKSFAGSRDQRPGAEAAIVLQVRREHWGTGHYLQVSRLLLLMPPIHSSDLGTLTFTAPFCLWNPVPRIPTSHSVGFGFDENLQLSVSLFLVDSNSNFIVAMKRSTIYI